MSKIEQTGKSYFIDLKTTEGVWNMPGKYLLRTQRAKGQLFFYQKKQT